MRSLPQESRNLVLQDVDVETDMIEPASRSYMRGAETHTRAPS